MSSLRYKSNAMMIHELLKFLNFFKKGKLVGKVVPKLFINITVVKGRLQSLLRMCDWFVMKSLLKTSFQSHGINENTRGRLNRSLLYCKE